MPEQSLDENGIKPYGPKVVFVEAKYCPAKATTYAICKAAEKNQGVTCYGAQERAGLWRIQTNTDVGRIKLLAGKFEMNNKRIEIHERNPYCNIHHTLMSNHVLLSPSGSSRFYVTD